MIGPLVEVLAMIGLVKFSLPTYSRMMVVSTSLDGFGQGEAAETLPEPIEG
jgi:hypothetical protein